MKKKISHFAVHKTSLTVAVLYTVLMLPFIMIMMVFGLMAPESSMMGVLMPAIFIPIYGILTYLLMALLFWIYNRIAKKASFGIFYTTDSAE